MSYQFNRIIIYSMQKKASVVIKDFTDWLDKKGIDVAIFADTADLLDFRSLPVAQLEDLGEYDLLVVIGGDGSMLSGAIQSLEHRLPILGINTGKLGFLVEHHPENMANIEAVLKGQYRVEERTLLTVLVNGQRYFAMNEVMISRQEVGRIMSMTLSINDVSVCQYFADGLIIATPTGSTAHALSAGGAIIHPESRSLLVIPVCPHKLNSRPIVIPDHERLTVTVDGSERISPNLSNDGKEAVMLDAHMPVKIMTHSQTVKLIHHAEYSFYETLKHKLHWEKTLNA